MNSSLMMFETFYLDDPEAVVLT